MSKLAHSSYMFEEAIMFKYCREHGIAYDNLTDDEYEIIMEEAMQWHEDNSQFGAGA